MSLWIAILAYGLPPTACKALKWDTLIDYQLRQTHLAPMTARSQIPNLIPAERALH